MSWLISRSSGGEDVIASREGATLRLSGHTAQRALAGNTAFLSPHETSKASQAPLVISDLPFDGAAATYATEADLLGHLGQEDARIVVCGERIAVFFRALLACDPRAPFTPILDYGDLVVAGPILRPELGPCARCWAETVQANLPSVRERVLRDHSLVSPDPSGLGTHVAFMRMILEAKDPSIGADHAVLFSMSRGTVTRERLRSIPGCRCDRAVAGGSNGGDVRGAVFGWVGAAGAPTNAVFPLPALTATSRLFGASGGAAGLDAAALLPRAENECIERALSSRGAMRAKARTLVECPSAPSLDELLPYTKEQYALPGFPYERLRAEDRVPFLDGIDLASGAARLVPALLVTTDERASARRFARQETTGSAAAESPALARERALLEIVERDVVTRSYYEGNVRRVDAVRFAPRELRSFRAQGLDLHLGFAEGPVPVAVAFLFQEDGSGAFGCAASFSSAHAARHAAEEAALMFTHRAKHSSLLPMDPRWDSFPWASDTSLGASCDLPTLIRHYRPIAVDLSTASSIAAGRYVVSVFSPVATRPPDGDLFEEARFVPSAEARAVAARGDLFS